MSIHDNEVARLAVTIEGIPCYLAADQDADGGVSWGLSVASPFDVDALPFDPDRYNGWVGWLALAGEDESDPTDWFTGSYLDRQIAQKRKELASLEAKKAFMRVGREHLRWLRLLGKAAVDARH